jgi:hypothetical protein
MKKIVVIFLGCLALAICHAQERDPIQNEIISDKYYPENLLIKQNKIKFVIDSSNYILPSKRSIKAYDEEGRVTGYFYHDIEKFNDPYVYKKSGDTLLRLKYRNDNTELYSYERFIYNGRGQILSYLECCDYYFEKGKFPVSYQEFYYNEENNLKSKLSYYKRDYNGVISGHHSITASELDLTDVVYYSFKKLKNGNVLVIGKHALGKPDWRATDSMLFDTKKRIIRFNSYAKMAWLGCPSGAQVNKIADYAYTDSSVTITTYTIDCKWPLSDTECAEYSKPDKYLEIKVYDKDKLMRKLYTHYQFNEKSLSDKFEYIYYD